MRFPRLICAFGHWTFVLVLLSPTQMQLPVGWAPHGVAVVDADVLPLLDIDCGSDHNPKVRIMKVNNNIVMYIFIKWKIIVNLLSPSKCLLALLMHECSRIEILAYRAWVGVGVTGTWTNRYFIVYPINFFISTGRSSAHSDYFLQCLPHEHWHWGRRTHRGSPGWWMLSQGSWGTPWWLSAWLPRLCRTWGKAVGWTNIFNFVSWGIKTTQRMGFLKFLQQKQTLGFGWNFESWCILWI